MPRSTLIQPDSLLCVESILQVASERFPPRRFRPDWNNLLESKPPWPLAVDGELCQANRDFCFGIAREMLPPLHFRFCPCGSRRNNAFQHIHIDASPNVDAGLIQRDQSDFRSDPGISVTRNSSIKQPGARQSKPA